MNKEFYLAYAEQHFSGKALELVKKSIDIYYNDNVTIPKNTYRVGEDVFVKKGTFLHGLGGSTESYDDFGIFDYVCEHGFIGGDFNGRPTVKILNSVGMWNVKEDQYLIDYIRAYSGITIRYRVGDRQRGLTDYYELCPSDQMEKRLTELNNDKDVWQWSCEQTKEVRFVPSLFSDKNQIAFILNMESEYAKQAARQDVWNPEFRTEDVMKYFCAAYFLPEMLEGNFNAATTDRESAIMFGLSPKLIEGVLVGRKLEKDPKALAYMKSKLPDCYLCSLDGKVIVGNR